MNYTVSRYNKDKKFIETGGLEVNEKDSGIELIYSDTEIIVSSSDQYHPLAALEKLRIDLEINHNSIIGINGCRIDTSYRSTGGMDTYLIEHKRPAVTKIDLFDSTKEIDKLCTVEEHKTSYDSWLESL